MTWQNPWAWIGLAAIAVPMAVHLLARRRAARMPFPTLRFLEASSRLSVRRQRLTDLALLAVRIGVLVAGVAALAQPFFLTAARRRDPAASLVRAIVIDTSASMQRLTPAGTSAISEARAQARTAAAGAAASRTIDAADLRPALDGAVAWLAVQPGRHEVVLISDFQLGSLTSADLVRVPAGTGIRTIRVAVQAERTAAMPAAIGLTRDTQATATVTATGTDAVWTSKLRAGVPATQLLLFAAPAERASADAARAAAFAGGLPESAPDRAVALVFSGAPERDALLSQLTVIDRPWMFEAVERLAQDATIASAARAVRPAGASLASVPADRATVVARDAGGQPLVIAGAAEVGAAHRLTLFSAAEAGSVVSAALVAGLVRATSDAPPLGEFEPAGIPADDTARWERAPTDVAPPAGQSDSPSDGRWLWAAALALLLGESWLRQRPREYPGAAETHERVA